LLIESSFKLFKIFIEHVFAAELKPASEMVDSHGLQHTMSFEDPVDLLFITPHHIPIVVISLLPLSLRQRLMYTVLEVGFELYVRTKLNMLYGGFG